jgi:hypothetical protein
MLLETSLQSNMTVKMKATLEITHTSKKKAEVELWYANVLDIPTDLIKDLYDF